jgi:hypothetical protein
MVELGSCWWDRSIGGMWAKRVFVRLSRKSFILTTTASRSVVARPIYHL